MELPRVLGFRAFIMLLGLLLGAAFYRHTLAILWNVDAQCLGTGSQGLAAVAAGHVACANEFY